MMCVILFMFFVWNVDEEGLFEMVEGELFCGLFFIRVDDILF